MSAVATEALTAEAMIKIAREQVDAFNTGDWERLQAGLAADARYHEFATQREVEGPEKIVELFKGWKTAFPDAAGTVTSAVGSGNMAALEVTWKGTHTGALETAEGTIPASGKRQETPAAQADRRAASVAARARKPERAAVQAAALLFTSPFARPC
jgi:SnoaL-like polyketide cyclase